MCAEVGVREESLPRCQWADEVIGPLNESVARQWGIRAGVPVVGGFVDTSAAILQTPMRRAIAHNSGSTDVLAMCVERPHPTAGVLTRPVGTRNGRWLAVRTIAASGSALAWARREWYSGAGDRAWNRVVKSACEASQKASELECIPQFAGNRAAINQGAGAAFSGIQLATTKEDLLAAIMRGLVRDSAQNYATLADIHRPARDVFFMGSARDLAAEMHRAWKRRHSFHRLAEDSMPGLVKLAGAALDHV